MEIIILGSGGSNPPPRPGSQSRICVEARKLGIPYYRTGPAFFIADQSLLIGSSEEIRVQLNREQIDMVENLLIPGWLPEHIMGLKILEKLNYDSVIDRPIWEAANVFLPPAIEGFEYFERLLQHYQDDLEIIRIHRMADCELIELDDLKVFPVTLEDKGFYFVIYNTSGKIVYIPSPFNDFNPVSEAYDADLFVAPCLFWEDQEIFRRPIVNSDIKENQSSFENILTLADNLRAKKLLFSRVDEDLGMSHHDLQRLKEIKYSRWNIDFAYDGMRISL